MSTKNMASIEELGLIQDTLRLRDPDGCTVAVGSAAIVAQFVEAGVEAPIGVEDVDVLCPQFFFDALLREGPFMEGIQKFQVRWPKGRLKERGATNKSVDIYADDPGILPFTASYSMSDLWYPIDYDSCRPDVVRAGGIRCLRIGRMLEWMAVVGRQKDTDSVEVLVPYVADLSLATDEEVANIQHKLYETYRQREQHPYRYYAHVDT